MADRMGNPTKQPAECKMRETGKCPHIRETSGPTDFGGETYHCDVCGEHYRLYYEDMA